jgi:hypothetical protein
MSKFVVQDAENPSLHWTIDLVNNTRSMTDASGRLVTLDLGQSDVHIDSALAGYAAGYQSADVGLIADEAVPVLPTDKASDKYFTWDKDDVFQEGEDLVVTAGGAVKEFSPRLSNATFSAIGYGAASFVPVELTANADAALNPQRQAVQRCLTIIRLARERRCATLLTTSGNWTGGYTATLGATAKWNSGSASNPVQDIYSAMEASLVNITALAMSERTYHDFVQNAQVQKFVASKTMVTPIPDKMSASQFSAILGLPPILIANRKAKTSTGYGYLWGDNVALLHADAGIPTGGQTISTARTFRWSGANSGAPDGTMQGGFLVRTYYDPKRGPRGGTMVVVTHNDAEIMTSVYAGGLIIGAHQ